MTLSLNPKALNPIALNSKHYCLVAGEKRHRCSEMLAGEMVGSWVCRSRSLVLVCLDLSGFRVQG